MSEQNILNPSPSSSLNPDYTTPIKVSEPAVISRWQARSGRPYNRKLSARGPVFDLTWTKRMFADYLTLQQWWRQYENDFFTFVDWDTGRYHSGMFAGEPVAQREANQQVTINAQFVVVPTLPLFQYPSNWAQDAVFIEERSTWPVPPGAVPSVNDLLKLTGSWDHHDQNYLLFSQDFENAVWSKQNGCTVTADQVAAPDGTITADLIQSGNQANSAIQQQFTAFPEIYTASISVRAGTASSAVFGIFDLTLGAWVAVNAAVLSGTGAVAAGAPTSITGLTAAWTRVSITTTAPLVSGRNYLVLFYPNTTAANTLNNYAWGSQLEIASAATAYTSTGATTVTLLAPTPNANLHGGFAYFDFGVNVGDAAEWLYLGYGFQVYSPKGPSMGIMQISLDQLAQGNVDLYSAAVTPSAPVFTLTNTPLAMHRVKLSPTDTKNAASAGFVICADALQVMR